MSFITSPNMNLIVPTVGNEPGPLYASDINSSLLTIDQHSHIPGQGVQITPAGLNINSDLTFNNNNLTNARSLRLSPQGSPLSLPSDLGCLYESGVDLYYNDGSGNPIRITQSGGIAGSPGSISGLVPPASATYVSSNQTFVWQSAVNTPANLDAASIILRNLVANSKGLTLSPPNSMGSDYSIILPSLPSVTSVTTIDNAGNMGTIPVTQLTPTGVIVPFGGSSIPSGYLLADGSAVSRTTYSALFAVIGTTFGAGNGTTTFNLPNGQNILFMNGPSIAIPPYIHSYWHMDSTGTEPNVTQVSGFNLGMTGTVPSGVGKVNTGGVLKARGPFSASNYLSWPASGSSTTPYDSQVFAVDCWVQTSSLGGINGSNIIGKSNSDSTNTTGWNLIINASGQIEFKTNDGNLTMVSPGTYNDGSWHYIAAATLATTGASNSRLYIDNALVTTNTGRGYDASAQDLFIGNYSNTPSSGGAFDGLIDDISYWNSMPGTWGAFETILSQRWNGGIGNPYGSAISVEVNYIVKT